MLLHATSALRLRAHLTYSILGMKIAVAALNLFVDSDEIIFRRRLSAEDESHETKQFFSSFRILSSWLRRFFLGLSQRSFFAKFRFRLPNFCRMIKVMQWECKTFSCGPSKNRIRADVCFMVLFRCLAYPRRFFDMVEEFGFWGSLRAFWSFSSSWRRWMYWPCTSEYHHSASSDLVIRRRNFDNVGCCCSSHIHFGNPVSVSRALL